MAHDHMLTSGEEFVTSLAIIRGGLLPELLSEIFAHCVPEVDGRKTSSRDRHATTQRYFHMNAPFKLLLVCKYWQHVALTTPRIWATIVLNHEAPLHVVSYDERVIAGLKRWIGRAGTCPLTIDVDTQCFPVCVKEEVVIRFLAKYARRWRHVRFIVERSLPLILDGLSRGVPRLEVLEVSVMEDEVSKYFNNLMRRRPPLVQAAFDFDAWAPQRLSELMLRRVNPRFIFHDRKPFGLRHLRVTSSIDVREFWEVLRNCPRLVKATAFLAVPYGWPNGADILTHTNVEELAIRCAEDLHPGGLFDHLSFPALRRLAIEMKCLDPASGGSWPTFPEFLARSRAELRSLKLISVPVTTEELHRCLQILPSLTKLELADVMITEGTLEALTPRNTEHGGVACLCPRLTYIHLEGVEIAPTAIEAFISSRWDGPSPATHHNFPQSLDSLSMIDQPHPENLGNDMQLARLETVHFINCGFSDKRMRGLIDQCRSRGVHLNVKVTETPTTTIAV
ncbi:hypothetical protein BD410DRAFT_902193 [Rickenella mellea]|uniref:Uncharacterized protein n=1 Tax=Rickenella mellea TaxID=50990 RepID=A0A4Y7PMT1_9AGAM|nr:hypothetical protein BD410DRAFT_902193 [Rickenella mellea]